MDGRWTTELKPEARLGGSLALHSATRGDIHVHIIRSGEREGGEEGEGGRGRE